jgi:predicted alpha/beta superfamily hydrolase
LNIKGLTFYTLCMAFACQCFAQKESRIPKVETGKIIRFENFKSKFVLARNIDVWLPDDYSKSKKYAVLYMHDGQMLFDSANTWNKQEWGLDEAILKLSNENKLNDFIVVGIWNSKLRHAEYTPEKPFISLDSAQRERVMEVGKVKPERVMPNGKPLSDAYLKFIVRELKPFVDSAFSTKRGRRFTNIAGSSKGGLISLYAICEYPKVFGGAACLSTDWPVILTNFNNPMPAALLKYLAKNAPGSKHHKLYFDHGTRTLDSLYERHQIKADSILREKGFTNTNFKSLKFEGQDHSEKAWRSRIQEPLFFLFGKK